MSGMDESHYNNSHRAFLQAFIARSVLTFEEAKPILAAICTAHEKRECLVEDITEADFNSYINNANSAISPFDLEIRNTYHQTSRSRVYALINSTSDPITQLATVHTADEISFLKRLLDAMFETFNTPRHEVMAVTGMQAVGLAKAPSSDRRQSANASETQGSSGQSLTIMQAEKMLKTLVEEGWFEKSRKGFYSLSPRALMELRGWLLETYNDVDEDDDDDEDAERILKIKQCFACREIITSGQRCSKRSCSCRLHDICTQKFFNVQKSTKCPICKTDWTGNDFVGERAAASMKEKSKRKSTNGAMHRRASPVIVHEDDVGERGADEDEIDEDG